MISPSKVLFNKQVKLTGLCCFTWTTWPWRVAHKSTHFGHEE